MISVEKLQFTYAGNQTATIKETSFKIQKGEIFGFLGPSGAGKTTTQKILIGIFRHYNGSVKVLEQEMKNANKSIYEHIGVAFEFPNLYTKFSALENLKLFQALYKGKTEQPEKLLEMVDLQDDALTRVSAFSKGMRMRLNFCRALLNLPEILFLDEPTSGLDPINARNIKNIILSLREQGKTIFLTTHNMTDADELCDVVAFIVDGQILLIDSPKSLKIEHSNKKIYIQYREGEKSIKMEFPLKNIGQNSEFLTLLQNKNIEAIHTGDATLEDIFIKVTGRKLK